MSEKLDAHIHLFEKGFGGSFTSRPGVEISEPECFESLMADYGVAGVDHIVDVALAVRGLRASEFDE